MSTPIELIVAAFQTEDGAENALKELKQAKKEHLIKIDNAAVIRKDAKGKVHIKETKDMGGGKGAAIGGVVGAAIGVLTGGVGLAVVGAGALVGGLAAKLSDGGFKDSRLKEIGDSLTPQSSAIVAVIEHKWVDELEREMEEAGAQVLTETISADIAAQLEAGGEVAYSLVGSDEGEAASRVATSEDSVEVSQVVTTAEGVEAMHAVATEEGVAAEHLIETDDAVAYEAAVVTDDSVAYVGAVATDEGVVGVTASGVIEDAGEIAAESDSGAEEGEDKA